MEHFKAAAVAADTKGDAVLRYCAVGRQLGYATYLTLDMVTFVSARGVLWSGYGKRREVGMGTGMEIGRGLDEGYR